MTRRTLTKQKNRTTRLDADEAEESDDETEAEETEDLGMTRLDAEETVRFG